MLTNVTVTAIIGGTDYSSKVASLQRRHALCTPGQTFVLKLDPKYDYSSLLPYQAVTLDENGVRVLTGYVSLVRISRAPNTVEVEGGDNYKLCLDTFVEDNVITDGETVGYWINYLCNLAGVPYVILADGANLSVVRDIPLGLKQVSDALVAIINYAGWAMTVDPYGVVNFLNLSTQLNSVSYTLAGARVASDENTRNGCVVWGLGVNYHEYQDVAGSGSGRTMVLSDPMITSVDQAEMIARYLLNQFANLDDMLTLKILGDPTLTVGQVTTLDFGGTYTNVLTDLRSTLDESGYRMELTMGRKCLQMAAIPYNNTDVYVATTVALGRSRNFYTASSGSVLWENLDSSGSSFGYDLTSFSLDSYNPSMYAYATTGSGIYVTKRLYKTNPLWTTVQTPADFQSATGVPLLYFANVKPTKAKQGTLYAQAVDKYGGIHLGHSGSYGSAWDWSSAYATSGSYRQVLGFETSNLNSSLLWTSGSFGQLWSARWQTSGSLVTTALLSTQWDASSPLRTIMTPTSGSTRTSGSSDNVIWIGAETGGQGGGGGGYYTTSYATNGMYIIFGNRVSYPDNFINAPDGNYSGFINSFPDNTAWVKVYPNNTGHVYAKIGVRFWVLDPTGWNYGTYPSAWTLVSTAYPGYIPSFNGFTAGLPSKWYTVSSGSFSAYDYITLTSKADYNVPPAQPGWVDAVEFAYSDDSTVDFNSGSSGVSQGIGFTRYSITSGSVFIDATPLEGGAFLRDDIATNSQDAYRVYASASGSYIERRLSSGSTWAIMDYPYTKLSNIVVHNRNNLKVYYLDQDGIYYTDDGFASYSNKTGNWNSVFPYPFSSGSRVAMAPVMV